VFLLRLPLPGAALPAPSLCCTQQGTAQAESSLAVMEEQRETGEMKEQKGRSRAWRSVFITSAEGARTPGSSNNKIPVSNQGVYQLTILFNR
jgi:hypothetical protein